ncbi:MAG: hypothetical protein HRU02_04085 [Myxococcales bacterium]|nr:hypothetical protein [Myxococcales bacterium]
MTREFEVLSHTMANNAGRQGLRVLVLPYPLETLPETAVREIAREHFPKLLEVLGAVSE